MTAPPREDAPMPRSEIDQARLANILDMAVGFTAMLRVFRPGSDGTIRTMVRRFLRDLADVRSREQFAPAHHAFCARFKQRIRRARDGRRASYGHAAKILNVSLKVCVHWCGLPAPSVAARVRPFLQVGVDTPILHYLKKHHALPIRATTIAGIGRKEYRLLQQAARAEADARLGPGALLIELDDVLWRELNR